MPALPAHEPLVVREDTCLPAGVHYLPAGVRIDADGVTLDGSRAVLIGDGRRGRGVTVEGHSDVTLRGLHIREYYHGIWARRCAGLVLENNHVTGTAEVAPNSVFLDIWRGPESAYGAGVFLWQVKDSRITGNDLQHQQNGLLTYACKRLEVRGNQASYNSGFGIHLYGTRRSDLIENTADYCCRFEPREGPLHYGHMGADAAGFLAVRGASHNTFRRNTARMGGDGFFLAGLGPDGVKAGCDHNLFEENDGSLSPNIAFEATFCRGNVFRGNHADRCNYGFWLGFSWDTLVEANRMQRNRQAGLAVENGHGFAVRRNTFEHCGHGVLLWSKHVPGLAEAFPECPTSYGWVIEENHFDRNDLGIRIAADQDHGIRPLPPESHRGEETRPNRHLIRRNTFRDSRTGIELYRADGTEILENVFAGNLAGDVREDECRLTHFRS